LVTNNYGRLKVKRTSNSKKAGYIKLKYCDRALEWINLRKIFQDLMISFQYDHLCPIIEDIVFAWSYVENLATVLYKPSAVFKQFSFIQLLDEANSCACLSTKRFFKFLDPLTINETSSYARSTAHVRTMDLSIIQHSSLRDAVAQGLNHIPLRPTNITHALATALDAFEQLVSILDLESTDFPISLAHDHLRNTCRESLTQALKNIKQGLRFFGTNDP